MSSIGEHLNAMVVTASSPDGRIHARVTNDRRVRIWFDPGAYHGYDEKSLAHQLARLGALAWVAFSRGRSEAYRQARDSAVTALVRDRDIKIITVKADYFDIGIPRRWRELWAQLRATGASTTAGARRAN